jgi:hypothetical protein
MGKNPYAPAFDALPKDLPIFPLRDVLLLPYGVLPLNVFEPRYMAMVRHALARDRMIGMLQHTNDGNGIYDVGCAGKITEFNETPDGRFLISLNGICRFKILKEHDLHDHGFRIVRPSWLSYEDDLTTELCLDIDRKKLKSLLGTYFKKEGMDCDWHAIDNATDSKLMTCLSMVCPFTPSEKQALLEAKCCNTRANMFMTLLEIAAQGKSSATSHH